MIANHLRRRLGISPGQAEELEPLAYSAVLAYLADTDPALMEMEIDDLDVKLRLERPFVTGYLVREVLADPTVDDPVVAAVVLDAFGMIDLEDPAEDAFPAFSITLFHHVVRLQGPDPEVLGMLLIAYDLHPEVLTATDPAHFVSLTAALLGSGIPAGTEASVLLGVMLCSARPSREVTAGLVDSYLGAKGVPIKEKRRFAASVIDGSYTKRFWTDRSRGSDLIDRRSIDIPSEIHDALLDAVLPWIRENTTDKEGLIMEYLGVHSEHRSAAAKVSAALVLVRTFGDDLPDEFCKRAIAEGSSFPEPSVSEMAIETGRALFGEGYNKEVGD